MPTMLERLKSLRKSLRSKPKPVPTPTQPNFSFDKLPTNVKVGILSKLSVVDLANFSATSHSGNAFIREHRDELPKRTVDSIAICYDPENHLACIRVVDQEKYFQSVVIPATAVLHSLECIFVKHSLRVLLGCFRHSQDQPSTRYYAHSPITLFMTDFTMPQIKRTRRFIVDIRDYLPKLTARCYTPCEIFRFDSLILIFQERYFRERAKGERISPMRRISGIFAKSNFREKAKSCQVTRRQFASKHDCHHCKSDYFLSTDFPLS